MSSRAIHCVHAVALLVCLVASVALGADGARRDERIAAVVKGADLVFRGRVIRVGSPPRSASGAGAVRQAVDYVVLETLSGEVRSGRTISVAHLVELNSATAERNAPLLSKALFRPGRELLVMAGKSAPRAEGQPRADFDGMDASFSVLDASLENLELARKAIREARSGKK